MGRGRLEYLGRSGEAIDMKKVRQTDQRTERAGCEVAFISFVFAGMLARPEKLHMLFLDSVSGVACNFTFY